MKVTQVRECRDNNGTLYGWWHIIPIQTPEDSKEHKYPIGSHAVQFRMNTCLQRSMEFYSPE